MRAEVGAKAIAYHIDAIFIHHLGQLVHLLRGKELSLIDQYPFRTVGIVGGNSAHHLKEICVGINPGALALYANATADYIFIVAGVDHRLHAAVGYLALLEIICGGEKQGGLGASHRAVSEI